jgi:hypothetical protein
LLWEQTVHKTLLLEQLRAHLTAAPSPEHQQVKAKQQQLCLQHQQQEQEQYISSSSCIPSSTPISTRSSQG